MFSRARAPSAGSLSLLPGPHGASNPPSEGSTQFHGNQGICFLHWELRQWVHGCTAPGLTCATPPEGARRGTAENGSSVTVLQHHGGPSSRIRPVLSVTIFTRHRVFSRTLEADAASIVTRSTARASNWGLCKVDFRFPDGLADEGCTTFNVQVDCACPFSDRDLLTCRKCSSAVATDNVPVFNEISVLWSLRDMYFLHVIYTSYTRYKQFMK